MAVRYGLANFHDGDHLVDLPVMEGASWAVMLGKPDELSCDIDLRDADVRALDIPSSTEPKKTVLFAAAEDGTVLAWGVISGREWDDDERTMRIEASGGRQYFHQRIIAPPDAETGALILPDGKVNPAFDTTINDVTLGSIGVALVEQALDWPGAPVAFVLPSPVADPGRTSGTYRLVDYKRVGAALDDLTGREDGPDFAFDARLVPSGLALEYPMRVGNPLLGEYVGSWVAGAPDSPITGLKATDDGGQIATHVWMQSGRTDSKVIVARARNNDLIDLYGYPVLDFVDTSRTDIVIQATLDAYATEHAARSRRVYRDVSFNVNGDPTSVDGFTTGPALGSYRPGDIIGLDIAPGNLYLAEGRVLVRITSMSGDETGETVKIACDLGVEA